MNYLLFYRAILIIAILTISNPQIFAKTVKSNSPSIFDELSYQEIVEINLELDMTEVFSDRKNMEKHSAIFSFENSLGQFQEWKIKVEQRGRFRRIKCENLPPIKLNFKKRDLAEAGFIEFDDMKLVTHCVNDEEEAKQLLVKEYLAYKIYNQITNLSFRVQFVKINYKDSASGKVNTQYGILIEDTAQLRDRIEADKVENAYNFSKDKYNSNQVKVVSLFQYMIGNSDWSIQSMRNVKVLLKDGQHILVPFDFDFSGLVEAPYAMIKPEHGITSTKDRVFLGFREDVSDLKAIRKYFKNKRNAIMETVEDCEMLSDDNKSEMLRYIDSFYKENEFIKLPILVN